MIVDNRITQKHSRTPTWQPPRYTLGGNASLRYDFTVVRLHPFYAQPRIICVADLR